MIYNKFSLIEIDKKTAEKKQRREMKAPSIFFTSPDAIGLFFFLGWSLSEFKSFKSLIIYIQDAIKLNEAKASKVSCNKVISNLCADKIGRKINKFLAH